MLPTSGYSEAIVSTFDSHNLQEEIPVCNTITKSLSDVIDIMWILNWNEMGVKQEKLTGPPILLWSRIFAQVFNE